MHWLCAIFVSASLTGLAVAQEVPGPSNDKEPSPPAKDVEAKVKKKAGPDHEIDVYQMAERIVENAQKASGRLKDKDPGAETRKIQEEIVKDIETLIRKAQEPPPRQTGDMSPMPPMSPPSPSDAKQPMGGGADQSRQPMGGMSPSSGGTPQAKTGGGSGTDSEGRQGRRARRDRKQGGASPKGQGDPTAGANLGGKEPMPAKTNTKESAGGERQEMPERETDRFGKASPRRRNEKLADLYKDVWGHLPDRLRQEMDLYYREKFMPRYGELLRQYYAALAEQKKSGSEDR